MLNRVSESFYLGVKKQWVVKKDVLRLGQAFLNAIAYTDPYPELFYERDATVCENKIYAEFIDPETIGKSSKRSHHDRTQHESVS